jgi:hypothetical protein
MDSCLKKLDGSARERLGCGKLLRIRCPQAWLVGKEELLERERLHPKKVNVERVSPRRARVHDQKLQQMKQN